MRRAGSRAGSLGKAQTRSTTLTMIIAMPIPAISIAGLSVPHPICLETGIPRSGESHGPGGADPPDVG